MMEWHASGSRELSSLPLRNVTNRGQEQRKKAKQNIETLKNEGRNGSRQQKTRLKIGELKEYLDACGTRLSQTVTTTR